jgi:thymidylate synthase|tara:strand:- start:787 stop:1818 length:1032 start_codon:yes stop_codon:yes gene_type:complete
MKVINAHNVNEAFDIMVLSLRAHETDSVSSLLEMDSRNGSVLVFDEPLTTVYRHPKERVLFSPERNCNPFFHFVEALWMLDGRNDLKTLTEFAKKMADFSDDGILVNGAYGYRWREYFGRDQLDEVINRLRVDKQDRRLVLQMWDARKDLLSPSKDVPCNTQIYFKYRPLTGYDGEVAHLLDMTVTNRSNDLIWGAYGANAVHFSVLHEYVATMANLHVGRYYQVSNNAHVYKDIWTPLSKKLPHTVGIDPYRVSNLEPQRLIDEPEIFDEEVSNFFSWLHEGDSWNRKYYNTIISDTAIPMVSAWWLYKEQLIDEAIGIAESIKAPDWRKVCVEWLTRRKNK